MLEIEKISDLELILLFEESIKERLSYKDYDKYKQELLKRLSKNNKTINFYSTEEIENLKIGAVEEFKKELIKIIIDTHGEFGTGNVSDMEINNILQLINNTK